MKALLLIVFALLLATPLLGQNPDPMKAFPPPDPGMARFVWNLPQQPNENDYRLEIIVGKTVAVDEVNRHFFSGKLEEETIQGFGFTRFIVRDLGTMGGTLIASDPNKPNVPRFVTLAGAPFLFRYNSRLPVVVYVPEGVTVQYRIWRAGAKTTTAKQG